MKNTLILGMIFTLASCGNPHISSSRSGLERTTPPVVSGQNDPNCGAGVIANDYKFFFDEEQSFKAFADCRGRIDETVDDFEPGQKPDITNRGGAQDIDYDVDHHEETDSGHGKVDVLTEIFGPKLPLSVDVRGTGKVLNSLNATDDRRDALVWTFSAPVSAWSAQIVGLSASTSNHAIFRLYDCGGVAIRDIRIDENHTFIGFVSTRADVCYLSLTSPNKELPLVIDEFSYFH